MVKYLPLFEILNLENETHKMPAKLISGVNKTQSKAGSSVYLPLERVGSFGRVIILHGCRYAATKLQKVSCVLCSEGAFVSPNDLVAEC